MTKLPDTAAEGPQAWEFDDIRVDLRLMSVTRGGVVVPLEPKAFDVLRHLIEHRDRLVTKEELLDAVWKDVFVTPNVLTRAVAQLRKGLGDEAREPKYIETAARRGYRFIGVVGGESGGGGSPLQDPPSAAVPADVPVYRRRYWPAAIVLVVLGLAGWVVWRTAAAPDGPPPVSAVQRLTSTGDVIDAAISRDGKYVAYVRSAGGEQSLWVRQTTGASSLQIVPPAPVGFWGVAFAPDSTSIYYVVKGQPPAGKAEGTLYETSVLPGPPPRRVLDGIDSAVTFSPDGQRMAFYRVEPDQRASALVIASRDGSYAETLVRREAPELFVPSFFATPAWSPDGATIAVATRSAQTQRSLLMLVAATTGAETVLQAEFGPIGFISWMADGSGVIFAGKPRLTWAPPQLWFQPLSGGPPRPVTADALEYRNVTVAADGRTLLAVGTDHLSTLWRARLGGDDVAPVPSVRGDGIGGLAAAGDHVVFSSTESGAPQLWSMRDDGSGRRQLTTDGWNAWPTISRDGRTVYFIGYRDEQAALWRMDAGGDNQRRVAVVSDPSHLRLSADERWLFFTSAVDGEDSLWRVGVDGGPPARVIRGLGGGVPSPDGRFVAGLWRRSAAEALRLAVFPIDGGAPLHEFPDRYGVGGEKFQWAADSKALLYTTTERTNVWRRTLAGGEPEAVTRFAEGAIFSFTLLPDGERLLIARGPSVRDAFLITGR